MAGSYSALSSSTQQEHYGEHDVDGPATPPPPRKREDNLAMWIPTSMAISVVVIGVAMFANWEHNPPHIGTPLIEENNSV
jgi:hypothetical protein